MKTGFTISAAAHGLVLAGAMVSLALPPPLQVPDVEALPVDIIPIETLTKSVQGDRAAPKEEAPAPKQTVEPEKQPDAVNVGDTEIDKAVEAKREAPEPPVEKTEAPAPAARPKPKEPTPVPTPEPLVESEEALKLPEKVATPKERHAAAEEKKKREEAKLKAAKKKKADDARKKAVVNKAQEVAGGAKRSSKKKSLGTKKGNNATKLAQSEIDALRSRLEGCWSAGILSGNPDAAKIRAKVEFKLARSGDIDGRVKVKVTGGDRQTKAAFAISVKSAVNECAPYNNLPAEKYDTWADVTVNFSLADIL